MNISVVIPNYNGEVILKKNLPKVIDALSRYSGGKVDLTIVDDFSTDNSVEFLESFIKNADKKVNIKLIKSNINYGFSSTVNKGAKNSSGELLLLLNSDVIPKDSFIDPLVDRFKDKDVFGVGALEESFEDGKMILRGRGIGRWQKGFLTHSAGNHDIDETLWVSGGSGLFRKIIWDKLGGLDETYNPFYWEDIDLSYRARKAGYKTIFERRSIVVHEHDKGAIKSKYTKEDVKKIAYRNQFIFAWKNSDKKNLILSFLWLPYHLLRAAFSGDMLLWQGFFGAFKLLPKILKSRISYKKLSVRSDQEVVIKK